MTQKELMYLEDAVNHEKSIVKILNDSISKLDDQRLISFMENERNIHQNNQDLLMSLLKEVAGE